MKSAPATNVRNFAIAGHAGSGKTSLADLMLFKAGKVNRLGKVQDKTSVSDFHEDEKERGQSLYTTPLTFAWQDHQLFCLDTPGSPDFLGEVAAALRVCDTALVVLNAAQGLEYGAVRAIKTAREGNCPRAIFVNCLDREQADFDKVLAALQEAYGATTCLPLTLPVGREAGLSGVVSVLAGKNQAGALAEEVDAARGKLLDTVAEADEALMTKYLDGQELTADEVTKGLHQAILSGKLIPVFCGSVAKDVGVTELLNGIVALFPHPLMRGQVPVQNGELALKEDGDGYAFVFKTIIDPHIGQLNLLRVYSGSFKSDGDGQNLTRHNRERLGSLFCLTGREQEIVPSAGPGAIIAVAKLKDTHTNDTMCTAQGTVQFPPITFPKPTMSYACYAMKQGEEDKIATGLNRLCGEDPTVRIERNAETHELIIHGMGDLHLNIIVSRLKANSKVEVELRRPKVPYRETVTGVGEGKFRHKKQSGGHGQFAEVWLRVAPLPGADFEFANEVVGGNIPKNFIPAVEKGVVSAMVNGPLARCKVINLKAEVYDGKYHAVDSSDIAFQIAARGAFREAMGNANPILLEPIMTVAIMAPDAYLGDLTGDLNHRRGRILGMAREEGLQVISADVPLAEMFGYASQLRSITQGRGSFTMEFARYEQVPGNVSKQIQEQAAKIAHAEE